MSDKKSPDEIKHNLGIAGRTAKMFINSPLSLLLIIAFLAIGILGLQITPRQEDPQISVPMVDIFVSYPGASAKEVESQVARPLEGIMSEITGVEHVYSASAHGQALVTVQFDVGENFESSIVKLHDKLESNKNAMPSGIAGLLVKPKGVDDVPVVTLTLWSNEVDDAQLRLISLDLLQNLREVADTSQSFIVDGRADQLQVEILPERLPAYGVSLAQVANSIRMANSQRTAGAVEPGNKVVNVVTGAFLETADDINRLMVAVVNGRPVYVRDVAKVTLKPSEANKMVGYYTGPATDAEEKASGASAVTLAIAKKHGSNGVDVAEAVLEKVEYLKGRLVPNNVHVEITRNYGATAKEKVNSLLFKLVVATLIVTILVWLFLGWRASTVVLIVIPIVITTTVFSAWALGLTIDRVSLFALIFSIGILVDDAIVVVENIYRRWLLIDTLDLDTAVDAVREVGNPTIVATFTVIAALLPMGFVSGMMGPYMSPIPVLGSVAMVISLFAAFAFTPWLTNKLKPSLDKLTQSAEKEHKQAALIARFFRSIIIPLIRDTRKGKALLYTLIAILLLSLTFFYTKGVRVKMLPLDNKSEFNIVVNLPEGTSFPVTVNLINALAREMQKVEEVTAIQTYAGTASPFNFNGLVRHYYLRDKAWHGDVQVQLVHKSKRHKTSHQIADEARKALTPIAQAVNARIQVVEMPPGPPVLQSVVAEIYGPSAAVRRQVAKDMTEIFEKAEGLADVDNFMEEPHSRLRFKVDADKAQRNGITVEDINRTIEMAMGGYILGDIKKDAVIEATPIVLQVPLAVRSEINRLVQLPVQNHQGMTVPLAELGRFISEPQDLPIYHKDLRAVEFVTGETVGRYAAPVYGMFEVQDLLAAANDGQGYRAPDGTILTGGHWFGPPDNDNETAFEWGGEWTVTFETFRDMGIAFMAALVLIYMLIVAQFGNFVLPAIVMSPIPLTLIGIIPGHWIMDAEFTATSMIGFIALAGIIVRNSILLVDFSRESVKNGMSVVDAVIQSCEARTRPIAITAFALMGGSMVILSDPIFQGMAVSLIFGGMVSTLLTLLVVPLGCISAGKSMCK
jgi:multidrug efflux pump subunit AcrB